MSTIRLRYFQARYNRGVGNRSAYFAMYTSVNRLPLPKILDRLRFKKLRK